MNETRSQLRIITALLVIVIALAGGLFFYMPTATSASGTPNTQPTVPQHQRIREAEISLDPSLLFYQTFGGSGDEQIVDVFHNDGIIYIFGNTTSTDLDFDRAGAFLCKTDKNGKTLGFYTYIGTLVKVTLYEGGFALALERDSSPVAIAVDFNGEELVSTAIPSARDEKTLDIKYTDDGYLFITALVWEIGGIQRLKMTMLDRELQFIGATVTNEIYSLEYVDTLDIAGDHKLMANAVSDLKNMLCFGSWGKILAYYPQEFSYTVHGFWVIDGKFYYLITTETATMLLNEDGFMLNLCMKARDLCITGDDTHIYISADDTLFCVSNDKIESSSLCGTTSFFAHDRIYSVSQKGDALTIRSFESGKSLFDTTFKYDMTSPKIFVCESGMFVIGNTTGKYGGSDITLVKVNY